MIMSGTQTLVSFQVYRMIPEQNLHLGFRGLGFRGLGVLGFRVYGLGDQGP